MNDEKIRPAQFAGQFYPGSAAELRFMVDDYLKLAKTESGYKQLKALIVPHAGYEYSAEVAAAGYKLLTNKKIKDIVLIGPAHYVDFEGLAYADYEKWETPLGQLPFNNAVIYGWAEFKKSNDAILSEHSIEVQIPFIQTVAPEANVTPLVTGRVEDYAYYLPTLQKVINDRFLIVSSDLSHYLPYDQACVVDKMTIENILKYKSISHNQACGADGINLLSLIAEANGWQPKLVLYKNSGDTAGDKDGVVGYAAIAYYV